MNLRLLSEEAPEKISDTLLGHLAIGYLASFPPEVDTTCKIERTSPKEPQRQRHNLRVPNVSSEHIAPASPFLFALLEQGDGR